MRTIGEFLETNKDEMREVLAELISYPTVESHDHPDYPFGLANAQCLDYILAKCESLGFKVKNLDYYAGFGEIGSGEEVLGIAGHLDIIPTGNNWESDPFTLTVKDGKYYGRGTSDNKGPIVSALFALKYIIEEEIPLNKRIRIVFGCNEENGFQCIEHYVAKEGDFDLGIVPDGPFPCCFGEKGIIRVNLSSTNRIFKKLQGGIATNSVPDRCDAIIEKGLVDIQRLNDCLAETPLLEYSLTESEEGLEITTIGRAAHASTPELGVNAVSYLLVALSEAGVDDPAIKEFHQRIAGENNGKSCGIDFTDQFGGLTLNVGMIEIKDNQVIISIDIRCPFTRENSEVFAIMEKQFSSWDFAVLTDSPGLYMPEESDFVQLLTNTYNEVMGTDKRPITMGGGTYARGIKNSLAFGPESGDEDTHIHDANEFVREEILLKNCEIYAKTIIKMLDL